VRQRVTCAVIPLATLQRVAEHDEFLRSLIEDMDFRKVRYRKARLIQRIDWQAAMERGGLND